MMFEFKTEPMIIAMNPLAEILLFPGTTPSKKHPREEIDKQLCKSMMVTIKIDIR